MKYFIILFGFLILVGLSGTQIMIPQSSAIPIPEIPKLEWSQANYAVKNGTGIVKIIVTDPNRNTLLDNIDTLKVFVFSDNFKEGITLTLYETQKNTSVFEMTFTFSDKRSAPNVLYAWEGDTVTAHYDTALSSDTESKNNTIVSTMFLGLTGPPLERAPASGARIMDSFGNTIGDPAVGEQVQITSDIGNGQDREQKFVWILQVTDKDLNIVSLAWIDGTLNPKSSFSPSASWIPQKEGDYTATMFVWESLVNPTALSPPISIGFTVIPEDMRDVKYFNEKDYDEMFLFIIPQKEFKLYLNEELGKLHFYKINDKDELSQLPRLNLLVNMTRDFPYQPITNLALRITDEQLTQYTSFFTQKCLEQRPYASIDICSSTEFAFEYVEQWYFVYPNLAPHSSAIEDRHPALDPDYFTRK